MTGFLKAALLAGLTAAIPGTLCAQPHPEGGHPAASHPAPAMHVSAPQFHAAPHRPVAFHHVGRPVTHYHRPTTHHYYHHHYVTHHTSAVVHVRSRLAPRVAALRRNVRASHRFHAGIYRAPPGYRYQRWGFGQFLPSVYWGRDFWLTDFLTYGLFAPPDGYVWVRYGPDALLIDQNTGEILQVDYGVFY
jgi:Ni/Co efflux regulator RcnB